MAQSAKYAIRGLHTSNSDISGVPEGSLAIAKNIDLSKVNLAQYARGFNQRYADLSDAAYRATKLFDYAGYLYSYYNTSLNYYSGSAWVSNGSITKPTNAIVPRKVSMNQNLYVASSAGLKKLDSYSGTLYQAGIPGGLMLTLTEDTSGTGTAVTASKYVAYRYFIGRYDANNNFIRGGVSGREIFANSATDRNVFVKGFLPSTIDNSYIIQVYRSDNSTTASVNDELYLCYELPVYSQFFSTYTKTFAPGDVNTGTEAITIASHGFLDGMVVRFSTTGTLPTGLTALTDYYVISANTNDFKVSATFGGSAVNITATGSGTHTVAGANQFAFKDITPSTLLGATIYTAASQQGILNNNSEPPLASDIAEYKNFLFYADVQSKYRFNFTLISVNNGASSGELISGDTITVSYADGTSSEMYTAGAAVNISTKTFVIDTVSASLATRIDATLRSFISVVNQASSLVYAYLTNTGDDDLPGKCMLESRALGGAQLAIVSSRQKAFNPQLTSSIVTNQKFSADAFRNGLMFSRQGEPEAVPLKNQFKIGSSDDPIKRILPLRDSLLIFKAKDGVYILRGENESSFNVSLLDSTAKLVAPESLVVLNSLVYGLFEAGISSVSDTSVAVVSDPIADKIQYLYGTCLQQVKDYAFAIAYETEGLYILSLPETSAATYSTYQLVYSVFTENFWEWDRPIGCGHVSSVDNKLYLGSGSKARVMQEYKTYTYTDFCDYEQSTTLFSYSTTTLTISGTDDMAIGDILQQSGIQPAYITAVDTSLGTVTVDQSLTWDTGSPVLHYRAYSAEIEWNPDFAGNPAGLKHYSACSLLFDQSIIQTASISYSSDTNPGVNTVTIAGPDAIGGWGYVAWGDGVWGGESSPAPTRIGVPRPNARCNSLIVKFSHRVAQSDWQLTGLALEFNPTSTRTSR